MNNVKISVVIPVFNGINFIENCLESVYNQTYPAHEIIIIDNNSNDDSWQLISRLKSENPSLKIAKEPSQGATHARNLGLKMSTGNWIQFLDVDDIIFPNKFEKQAALCHEDHSYIASGCRFFKNNSYFDILPLKNPFKALMYGLKAGTTSSNLWNKKHLLKIGGWNTQLKDTQDHDLMFRLLKLGSSTGVVFEILATHTERKGQISSQEPFESTLRHIDLRRSLLDFIKNNYPFDYKNNMVFYTQCIFRFYAHLYELDIPRAAQLKDEFLIKNLDFTKQDDIHIRWEYRFFYNIFGLRTIAEARKVFKTFYNLLRNKVYKNNKASSLMID